MPPGQGGSNSGNNDTTQERKARRIFRRNTEKKNPGNVQFERQVAAVEARQEREQQSRICLEQPVKVPGEKLELQTQLVAHALNRGKGCALLGPINFKGHFPWDLVPWEILSHKCFEDGDSRVPSNNVTTGDAPEPSDSWPSITVKGVTTRDTRCQIDSPVPSEAKSAEPNHGRESDFLEGTFIHISSDKQKGTKNNKKKNKKKRGKCRKKSNASEMQCEQRTDSSSSCTGVANGEAQAPSSNIVVTDVQLKYASSPSIRVKECSPVPGTSSGNGMELSCSSNDFSRLDSTSNSKVAGSSGNGCYNGRKAWSIVGDVDTGNLSAGRGEWPRSASESTDSLGFNKLVVERNKPNLHQSSYLTIASGGNLESSRCNDTNGDEEFQVVISRKRAHKVKNMQLLESKASAPKIGAPVSRAPREVTIGHYMEHLDLRSFSERKDNHKNRNYQKGPSFGEVPKTGFPGENAAGKSRMLVTIVHPENPDSSQMAVNPTCFVSKDMNPTSMQVAQEAMVETCSSESLPVQGELKALHPKDGDDKDTDSIAPSCYETSCLDHVESSCVDREKQKKEDDELVSSSPATDLDQMIQAANDAYESQTTSVFYLISGDPVADFETFVHSATPVVGQLSCTISGSNLQGQNIRESPYRDQMLSATLKSLWQWYEEPSSFGIEVELHRSLSSGTSGTDSVFAYFIPLLSAVQLFGQAKELRNKFDRHDESSLHSPKHGQLLFQYFESERPSARPPLFSMIKQLVNGVNISGYPIFGDQKKLGSVKLSDLHPASWFSVAWYPIYRIPPGRSNAAFLTYHSLGKLAPQTCYSDTGRGLTHIICPIVGMLCYNNKGEQWFQRRESGFKATSDGSSENNRADVLKERLRTLRHGASAMSKAVVPSTTGEAMNFHPDYEFFLSRSS